MAWASNEKNIQLLFKERVKTTRKKIIAMLDQKHRTNI